ncbi:MAG: methyltransferase domain-containing protein [Alphaproteobacteria bacterium]|nr:methyltransferase domain-containing protein [Alphaproteobacteria bacterium]
MHVFDRKILTLHRNRAAQKDPLNNFLFVQGSEFLIDKLADIQRSFTSILELGCRRGEIVDLLVKQYPIDLYIQTDLSYLMCYQAQRKRHKFLCTVCLDEENLPFRPHIFDLIISNLNLHWINDLPGCLAQIYHLLKPDGLFLASVFGGQTLNLLREVLLQAESEITGGASPRVIPFIDLQTAGNLMQRAGFNLSVTDSQLITVQYKNLFTLMHDLQAMGENNNLLARFSGITNRKIFLRAAEIYKKKLNQNGSEIIEANFEIINFLGWRPHSSQPKPLKPGSATINLADFLSD